MQRNAVCVAAARWSSTSSRYACWGCTCGQGGPRHARHHHAIRHRVVSSVQYAMHNLGWGHLRRHLLMSCAATVLPCPMLCRARAPCRAIPCRAVPRRCRRGMEECQSSVVVAVRRLLRAALGVRPPKTHSLCLGTLDAHHHRGSALATQRTTSSLWHRYCVRLQTVNKPALAIAKEHRENALLIGHMLTERRCNDAPQHPHATQSKQRHNRPHTRHGRAPMEPHCGKARAALVGEPLWRIARTAQQLLRAEPPSHSGHHRRLCALPDLLVLSPCAAAAGCSGH